MTKLHLNLGDNSYNIYIGRGLLSEAGELFDLKRRVLIVTDNGVPAEYARTVASGAETAKIITLPRGEGTKSIEGLSAVLSAMCDFGMTRGDCVVAVGGGVIGDLAGFAAASYMRGVDFYNIPTTLLSQVDSSIGGKTAINFSGIKNIVGAFHQPRGVIVDADCLKTLPERQIANGLAEAVKMSMTSDAKLFRKFEEYTRAEILENIEEIIIASLKIKRAVVESDEREAGLRKILNFGHTFGHGVEAEEEMRGFYHGECVAIGMIPMCEGESRQRLLTVLNKIGLPTEYSGNVESALDFVIHDKKAVAGGVSVIYVPEIGTHLIKKVTIEEFRKAVRAVY